MSGAITANNPRIGYQTFAVFGTISADQEDPAYPVTNLANPATFLQWRGLNNNDQAIYIALPEAQTADYVAAYGHNWGSKNTTVTVEYTLNGTDWVEAVPPTIPDSRDRVYFKTFEPITADFWRIKLEPTAGALDDPPEASLLYLGEVLTIPNRVYVGHTPLPFGRNVDIAVGVSTNGQYLGRVLESITHETSIQFERLPAEFVRDEFDAFIRAALDRPFFFSWRPEKYDTDAGLAWFKGSGAPTPQNARENGWMSVTIQVEGVTLPPHVRASDSSSLS